MKCRAVFPAKTNFAKLRHFFDYAKSIIRTTQSKEYSANFFLFGEDVLGVTEGRIMGSSNYKKQVVTHEEVEACISNFQKEVDPDSFLIFSLYCYRPSGVVNAVYFVGKNRWFFDFKRNAADWDKDNFGSGIGKIWAHLSNKHPKSQKYVKAGGVLIQNLYLLVCAEIKQLPKMGIGENVLVLVPAGGLPVEVVPAVIKSLSGSGHIFVNDSWKGIAWAISFGAAKETIPKPIKFGKERYKQAEFEL